MNQRAEALSEVGAALTDHYKGMHPDDIIVNLKSGWVKLEELGLVEKYGLEYQVYKRTAESVHMAFMLGML